MTVELDVLRTVSGRLEAAGLAFMVTGSMALAYYVTPRMTRDIDVVVALSDANLPILRQLLADDFYFDEETARQAIRAERLFNLMHYASTVKVDVIVRKSSPYRKMEFERRQRVSLGKVPTWIVSREDLILSKLVWAQDSRSELQFRDVRELLAGAVDMDYIRRWAGPLGVESVLPDVMP